MEQASNGWIYIDVSRPKEVFQLLAGDISNYCFQFRDIDTTHWSNNNGTVLVGFDSSSSLYPFKSSSGNYFKQCRYKVTETRELTPQELWERGIVAVKHRNVVYQAVVSGEELWVMQYGRYVAYSVSKMIEMDTMWTSDRKTWHTFTETVA